MRRGCKQGWWSWDECKPGHPFGKQWPHVSCQIDDLGLCCAQAGSSRNRQTAPERRLNACSRKHAGKCISSGHWLTRGWCKRPAIPAARTHHRPAWSRLHATVHAQRRYGLFARRLSIAVTVPAQRWLASLVVMMKAPGFSMRRSPVALHSQLSRDLHDSRIALAGGSVHHKPQMRHKAFAKVSHRRQCLLPLYIDGARWMVE